MATRFRHLSAGLVGLVLLAAASGVSDARAQGVTRDDAVASVRRALERLPYYGVFDYIAFGVDRGTVTLAGYSYTAHLKGDAETAVRRAVGVDAVVNRIEVLPLSPIDDRNRWATFYRIYTDDFLSQYAPGGVFGVFHELRTQRRFPGLQPVGRYPIHIVIKDGRTMLLGIVDNEVDRRIAEARAREVTGVFSVENGLMVAGSSQE